MSSAGAGVFAFLLVAASVGPAVLPVGPSAAPDRAGSCFPPGGHDIEIGTEGPRIRVTIHSSLFTNLSGPGAFGVEAVGTAGGVDLLTLRAGVLFDGVGRVGAFVADPFSRFSTAFYYRFRLPVFAPYGHGVDYETDRSPVSGVNASAC